MDLKEALDIYLADKDKGDRHSLKVTEELYQMAKELSVKTNGKVDSIVAIVDYRDVKLKPFMSKIMERKTHAYHDNVKTV